MTTRPQPQFPFLALPREIRDLVYLELWRACGLRQHILWHHDEPNPHLCRWPCRTEFRVDDPVQAEIDVIREQLGFVPGRSLDLDLYARRLRSPWLNHVLCGEDAEGVHGLEAGVGRSTGLQSCWKRGRGEEYAPAPRSPYIPMLLSCKTISSECLESIYASTSFIFTDPVAYQFFIGHCRPEPAPRSDPARRHPRPSFFQHTTSIELSLPHNFSDLLSCVDPWMCDDGVGPHAGSFHWLQLERFCSLRSVKLWIAARSLVPCDPDEPRAMDVHTMCLDGLREMLACLAGVRSATVSTPLVTDMAPEEGYLEDFTLPGVDVWKRGTGDRFHPHFFPVVLGYNQSLLRSWPKRRVLGETAHRGFGRDYQSRLAEMRQGHQTYVRIQWRIYRGARDLDETNPI